MKFWTERICTSGKLLALVQKKPSVFFKGEEEEKEEEEDIREHDGHDGDLVRQVGSSACSV